MKQRCYNPKVPQFKDWGGRGVAVCAAWRDSYETFLRDMGPRPDGLSLDRIDNARGYDCGRCPDCTARGAVRNCRWATRAEQARNTRANHRITWRGETKCISAWEAQLGFPRYLVSTRLKRGWTEDAALSTPPRVATDVVRACVRCGATFKVRAGREATAKYCSRDCFNTRAA